MEQAADVNFVVNHRPLKSNGTTITNTFLVRFVNSTLQNTTSLRDQVIFYHDLHLLMFTQQNNGQTYFFWENIRTQLVED